MTALTKDRSTSRREAERFNDPVAAGKKIYAGSIIVLNATGYAEPGATATGLVARGIAREQVDNSAGADGDLNVESFAGEDAYRVANDGSIDRTHIGGDAYIVDDQTVAATDGTGTRSIAGKIVDVDSSGVWIRFYQ